MDVSSAVEKFIDTHLKTRPDRDAERLESGFRHAEQAFLTNVWWPAFQNFDNLYPEYPVHDYSQGTRYIDFAYVREYFKVAIEIDGISTHWRNISQEQFSDHCQRQNHLVIDDWHVLRFAYSTVQQRPRICQQTLQQLIGKLSGTVNEETEFRTLQYLNQAIIKLALGFGKPITPKYIATLLRIRPRVVANRLHALVNAGWMEPVSGSARIRSYRINANHHLQI